MNRIAENFSMGAGHYDEVVKIQPLVAAKLAAKLAGQPRRILEIGCGTGALSQILARRFPEAELVLTDISPPMLEICRKKLAGQASFNLMNGEFPDLSLGHFDLIVSSLAMQWFADLQGAIARLALLLNENGCLAFATLGSLNFLEWRELLKRLGLQAGMYDYPKSDAFPWPVGLNGKIGEEFFQESHANGLAFLKALKMIGAHSPPAGRQPLPNAAMKRILSASSEGFTVTYHVLYGDLTIR
ncbi:methyltransferase [Acidocella sp.]|uniref:methyltransferase n=1 Tax=Acidocella sp. TaxID=50710 RepID=UPI003CFCBCD1